MSCHLRALLVLAAHGQDQPTKVKVQVVQVAVGVGEPMGVRGEGTRSRSYGLFAHQVLALVLVRLVW